MEARAVESFTDEVKAEIEAKGALKVFSCGGTRFYECPLTYLDADTAELIRLCVLIEESKILLQSGGWGDQPAWLIEAYEILKVEQTRWRTENSKL